jgi:hypothetical protein
MTTPASGNTPGRTMPRWTPVQLASLVVGAGFLLVGLFGFIPGITTDYNAMTWAGHESEAMLLGMFQVSILHNLIHLAFGVAGLLMAWRFNGARAFLLGGGLIYALLWIYGLVISRETAANFVPVNNADNWLHFGLAVGMIALGLLGGVRASNPATGTPGTPPPDTPPGPIR